MPISDEDVSHALLVSTRDGTYPDSEELLTTDLKFSALSPSVELVNEAKHDIEVG
jgi:hypothetical protein